MFLVSESGHYAFCLFRQNALGYVFVKSHASLKTDFEIEHVEGGFRIRCGEHYVYAADEVDGKVRLGTTDDYDATVWTPHNRKYGMLLCVDTTINHLVLGTENPVSLC